MKGDLQLDGFSSGQGNADLSRTLIEQQLIAAAMLQAVAQVPVDKPVRKAFTCSPPGHMLNKPPY